MSPTVILSATRTPVGAFQGALATVPAWQLGAAAVAGAVARAGIAPGDITDVILGNVLQAGQGQAPARQAALRAGLPPSARTATINKVCGSGMEAVMQSAHALAAGAGTFWVAGGMENMSLAPHLLPQVREGYRLGHRQVLDSLVTDGLWDPYNNLHMGSCAEKCAEKYRVTREAQDAYAIASFQRANAAQQAGKFAAEITPVDITGSKGGVTPVTQDEGPAKVAYEKIPRLKPAFQPDGTITAANASTLNDGAAAIVLASADTAKSRGLKPIARLVAFGAHAQEPLWFTMAPVAAARSALQAAGWSVTDVDLWEINEAFAIVPMVFQQELGLLPDRINVHGGAIALGHPLGASGARIIVTLLSALKDRGLRRGVAAVCIGGGEGLAVCLELI